MRRWLIGCAIVLAGCSASTMEAPRITPAEAKRLIGSDSTIVVLDVRTHEEYAGPLGHLDRALLIPVQELDLRVKELEPYKSRTMIVYCRTGGRSTRASTMLRGQGFKVLNMDGGITRWNHEHLPVTRETPQDSVRTK